MDVWVMWRKERKGALDGFVHSNWLLWLSPSQVIESEADTEYSGVDG